jgi:hypothetical protein
MSVVLRIDSDGDLTLQYGVAFRDKFVFRDFTTNFANHVLIETNGANATDTHVTAILSGNSIQYISGLGHGLYDRFTGHQGRVIWSQSTMDKLNGTVVHLLSCQTGGLLGRAMVNNGVAAFWGYTSNFSFPISNPTPTPLDSDPLPEMFLKMDAIIDRGILSCKDSDAIYNSVTKYVVTLLEQKSLTTSHRAMLIDNYVHLVCPSTRWGNSDVTI